MILSKGFRNQTGRFGTFRTILAANLVSSSIEIGTLDGGEGKRGQKEKDGRCCERAGGDPFLCGPMLPLPAFNRKRERGGSKDIRVGERHRRRCRRAARCRNSCQEVEKLHWPLWVQNKGEKPLFIGFFFKRRGIVKPAKDDE